MYIVLNSYVCVFQQEDMIPVHYAAAKDHDEVVELFFKVQPSTMTQINAVSRTELDFKQTVINYMLCPYSIHRVYIKLYQTWFDFSKEKKPVMNANVKDKDKIVIKSVFDFLTAHQ